MRHDNSGRVRFALWVIGGHAVLTALHGAAHQELGVVLSSLQAAFVLFVIVVAPLISGFMLWKNFRRTGGITLACAMAGALIFGVYNHFIAISGDHVSHLARTSETNWIWIFQSTAALIAVLEVLGIWAGIQALKRD